MFPVNLLGIPPDALGEFARQAGEEFFGGRYSVALSFCDAPTPDRWHDLVSGAEEVWAPSEYSAGLLGQLATVPVNVIPIPVAPGPFRIRSRTELGLPHERFLFLARFDATSEFERQNPLAAIEAFVRASLPAGRAQLIVECLHGERDPRCEQLRDAAAGNPDIQLLDASSGSHEASLALMSACDCYLSLHRAEAFGIAMAQAMWLGKPVIATGYSGNREFMSVQNSLLVEHSVASPPVGGHGLGGGHWVDPDVEHAATLLRQTFEDPAAAQALGARAAAEIRRTRSPAACAEVIGRRLELIRATGVARDVVRRVPERPPAVAQAQARIAQGPPPVPRGGRGRRVRGFVRKLILRMLRPYTDYQEKVNSELAAGLSDLGGSIGQGLADARAEVAVERAQLMMELRRSAQPEAAAEGTSTEQAVPTNTDH